MIMKDSQPQLQLERLAAAEQRLGFAFPEDYRKFLLVYNGGRPTPSGFEFTDTDGEPSESLVNFFFSIHDETAYSVEVDYEFFVREERIPASVVPIADDPFGNLICLSVRGEDLGHVYFWDHERELEKTGYENLALIADSFTEFLDRLTDL